MTRRSQTPSPDAKPGQFDRYRSRILDEPRHDPYQPAGKYATPTHCGECGAVYDRGRWHWGAVSGKAARATCPACRRIHDKLPAGMVTLRGDFVLAHRSEIAHVARNQGEQERVEHCQNRIMWIVDHPDRMEIATTDIHLPQRIGEALKHAYHGELDLHYGPDEYSVRVDWAR